MDIAKLTATQTCIVEALIVQRNAAQRQVLEITQALQESAKEWAERQGCAESRLDFTRRTDGWWLVTVADPEPKT